MVLEEVAQIDGEDEDVAVVVVAVERRHAWHIEAIRDVVLALVAAAQSALQRFVVLVVAEASVPSVPFDAGALIVAVEQVESVVFEKVEQVVECEQKTETVEPILE